MKRIPFIKPYFPPLSLISRDLEGIRQRNIYSNAGPLDHKLADRISALISEQTHTSVVSSGMSALMLAVRAAFLPGRRFALMPSFTFAAGPEAVMWSGFKPIFIDIEKNSLQPSIKDAKRFLASKGSDCAGILLCNSFGVGNQRIEEWQELSLQAGIPMVIDSAAGFGSYYSPGCPVGTYGSCEIFSFHITKPFGIGEGGAVVSQDLGMIERIERMKNFGFDADRGVSEFGLNAKISEMACAVGLRVLDGYPARLEKRRTILSLYKSQLSGYPITFQDNDELSTVPFVTALLPDAVSRQEALELLQKDAVEARAYYNPPLHEHHLFNSFEQASALSETRDVCSRVVSLPVLEEFQAGDVNRITSILKTAISRS